MKLSELSEGTKGKLTIEGRLEEAWGGKRWVFDDGEGAQDYFYPPQDAEVEVAPAPEEPKSLYAIVTVGYRTYVRLGGYFPWFIPGEETDEGFNWREIEGYAREHGLPVEVKHEGVSE